MDKDGASFLKTKFLWVSIGILIEKWLNKAKRKACNAFLEV